ncbi:hypothetical protein ABZ468_37235 [Streptomyces sp. NPDC005708]
MLEADHRSLRRWLEACFDIVPSGSERLWIDWDAKMGSFFPYFTPKPDE